MLHAASCHDAMPMQSNAHRWDKPVVIYGDSNLDKNNPVVAFLAKEKRAKSISLFKAGYAAATHILPYRAYVHMHMNVLGCQYLSITKIMVTS